MALKIVALTLESWIYKAYGMKPLCYVSEIVFVSFLISKYVTVKSYCSVHCWVGGSRAAPLSALSRDRTTIMC